MKNPKKKPVKKAPAAAAVATAKKKRTKKSKCKVYTSAELKKLALDCAENRIFGSWQMSSSDTRLIGMVFLPLAFSSKDTLPSDIAHVYADISKAGPRAINGYPMFYECAFISQAQYPEFCELVKKLIKQRNAFLNDE
jgi:hypothetical protein